MIKKGLALVTLASFLVFSWSCVVYRTRTVPPEKVYGKDVNIVGVYTKSGEHIEFPKDLPALIIGEKVIAKHIGRETIKISKNEVIMNKDSGQLKSIETKSGKTYSSDQIIKEEEEYFIVASDSGAFSAPLKDIEGLSVREVNVWASLLLDILVPTVSFIFGILFFSGFVF
jgi:restriction endonuclease S subunit